SGTRGGGAAIWIGGIPGKRKFAGAQRAAEPIRESERLGCLRERNAAGGAGEIPNRMLPPPLIGNARATFGADVVASIIEPRQVGDDELMMEAAGEIHPADGEASFLPFGRAAQLRKRLSKQR